MSRGRGGAALGVLWKSHHVALQEVFSPLTAPLVTPGHNEAPPAPTTGQFSSLFLHDLDVSLTARNELSADVNDSTKRGGKHMPLTSFSLRTAGRASGAQPAL